MFLKSLLQSALDYLGTPVEGAVLTVPVWFTPAAREALKAAAEAAGITVLQLLDEPGAAAVVAATEGAPDRTSLILDVGSSQTDLAIVTLRAGLASVIASSSSPDTAGTAIDNRLIAYFAKEFTKKTKEPFTVPAKSEEDARAERKLRLAIHLTKQSVSASSSASACSVESLKAGLDFSNNINRLRFDLEATPIYTAIAEAVRALLTKATLEPLQIDDVVLVGGTAKLPGLVSKLEMLFPESTEFSTSDPTEVLSRGAALHARTVVDVTDNSPPEARATARPLGIFFPGAGDAPSTTNWITVVPAHTPLPARRTVTFPLRAPLRVGFEAWEARSEVVHPPAPQKPEKSDLPDADDEEDDFDDEDEPPAPELVTHKDKLLGALSFDASKGPVSVEFVIALSGVVTVAAWGTGGQRHTFATPAP